MEIIVQLITAGLGTVGFCLMFNVKKEKLLPISICGVVCWGLYRLFMKLYGDIFIASFTASFFVAVIGELLSHCMKAPTTVFFIPACIPLIPGGGLYRTMLSIVRQSREETIPLALDTIYCAVGISAGLGLAAALVFMGEKLRKKRI